MEKVVSTPKFCRQKVLTSKINPIAIAIKLQPLLRCTYDHTQISSTSQTLLFLQSHNVSISITPSLRGATLVATKQSISNHFYGLPRPLCGLAMTCMQPKTSLIEQDYER
ncbi:hypothetical protein [Candidatus Tisiphia endosymbiont of Hybos culiciformis]|uniref:hypothetical protein n=1 Tax=Candidatus Tisiphia endosymbiont of Hybos culiciformis TaxID=3139331 RepID=UPI003CCB49E8